MRRIVDYLKNQSLLLLLFGLIIIVILGISAVYDLSSVAINYILLLLVVLLLGYLIINYIQLNKKEKFLNKLFKEGDMVSAEQTIPYQNATDQIYLEQLKDFIDKLNQQQRLVRDDYNELKDLITLWLHQIKLPISSLSLMVDNNELNYNLIKSELVRIEQYSEMVMMLLKTDSDNNDFVFEKINLDKIITDVIKRFKYAFINQQLSIDYHQEDKYIISDKKHLQFLIEQIISNALKYTKQGGIKIFVNDYDISIIDSGIGISSSDLPRIFDKNYSGINGHQTTQSSGMGLYLCKKIANMLDIDIAIDSKVGKGTVVKLRFNSKITKM